MRKMLRRLKDVAHLRSNHLHDSVIILEPRNTSAQMESHPAHDSRFQKKINALQTQSLQPTQATVVPSDQTCSHNSLDQSLESLTDELQQLEDAGKFIA